MEQGKPRVPKSQNRHTNESSPDVAVAYNGNSCKGVGRDTINLSDCEEKNVEIPQTVQKPYKSFQQSPKKVLNIEDCVSPAKQSPISPMKTSSSDMKSVYVTKPQHRRQAGREDRSTTDGGGSLKATIVDSQMRGLHANRENGGSLPGTREPYHHGQDQLPLSHHYQGRLGNKLEGTSPSCERRILVEGGTSAPSTPGRSKLRGTNTRPNETPDRSAPLPKFGDWNEKDPTSADDFTHIFNKRRQEKLTGVSTIPAIPPGTPSQINSHKHANVSLNKSSVWCCMAPRTFE